MRLKMAKVPARNTECQLHQQCRDFSNISSMGTTGFHKQAKLFELNFCIRKTFLWTSGQTRQEKLSSVSQSICPECQTLNEAHAA